MNPTGETTPAGGSGNLAEHGVIALQVAHFRGRVDDRPCQYIAALPALAAEGEIADVASLLPAGIKIAFIGSRAGLRQADAAIFQIRSAADEAGDRQEIVESVSFFDGVDGTCPLPSSTVICVSKSVFTGDRETPRDGTCAQNLAYMPVPIQFASQRLNESPVNTAVFPRPACQWR